MKFSANSLVLVSLLCAITTRGGPVSSLFSSNYLPHQFCYLARPWLIWTNVLADGLIALSYAAIFVALLWSAHQLQKLRHLRAYLWIPVSFSVFIVACGGTHAMEIVTVWWPIYPLSAAVKILCAAASVPTAILFVRVTPALARHIPSIVSMLSQTERERDEARAALLASEQILEERKRADAEIAAAYEQLNHIMDSTSEGILKIGSDWKMLYANRRAREISPEIVLGVNFWECFPGLLATVAETGLRRAMEDRVETSYEVLYERYGLWFRVVAYPTVAGISSFYSDVTAEKRLQAEIAQERAVALANITAVMDSTQDGILRLATDWTVTYGNRKAWEVLPDLALGKRLWDCFPGLAGTAAEEPLRRTMNTEAVGSYDYYYEPYDHWYRVSSYAADGGMSIFFTVITAEKKLQQQLDLERRRREQRIEALGHMAGGLAHEISNPLAIIHGTASDLQRLAAEHPLAPLESLAVLPEVLKASELIVNTSDRAIRILRGLRGFAREAGNDPMEYASVYDIVEEAVQLQEGRFTRNRIELRTALEPGIPMILCRETQIGQIVTNLVNNAFDAILEQDPAERWVLLEASHAGNDLRIDVSDSGKGIPLEARERLMEPFFTTKTGGVGMGVGLSLSRAIAVDHGGSLELRRDSPCTCFRLLLPAPPSIEAANTEPTNKEVVAP